MEPWFTYIIECADNTLYVGTSNNVEKRVAKHNSGKGAKYTKGRAPVKLSYSRSFSSRAEACKHEYLLKQYSRTEKLNLIRSAENEVGKV